MTTFETPQPIAVVVDVSVRADIWIVAGNRSDTVVNVQPRTASRALDIKMAEQTTVDYSDGRLQVRLRPALRHTWFSDGGAVDITVEVPIGCGLDLKSGMGDLRCEGEFSSADLKTDMGHVRIDHCTDLRVHTGMGDVTVERVAGRAEIKTGSGKIRVRDIDGIASVKNGNGSTHIVDAAGELHVSAANGDVVLERAGANTTIKASNGDITIGEVARGTLTLQTAAGSLAIGIREGSAAWLDLSTKYGRVRNGLDATSGPGETDAKVEIRARSAYGDITVRRSPAPAL
ncbi:DUF4097 family beta strand repeat-containing protein [Arthrobacter cavernae]|uniref:DUF4097 family beta strand repeat protein n=1 Tax=Arthrobacter cavernae TaxID=2817681 RepID=A0A939HI04_9MICC|nr:DUF4097 family beta strand repeat-containing protein [Arthrobacter cavernae]MBO1267668.1 DUF4097 family beta strand repeat protein [Arthrobacter cavernae]